MNSMKKYVALAALLSVSCRNVPKGNAPIVVGVNSCPSVLVEEVQNEHVSRPSKPPLDEKVKYVHSVLEDIQKFESDSPAQVIRTVPNSKDFFEVVYFPDMACFKTPHSDQETEEKLLELEYRSHSDKKSINIRLRDYHPFASVDNVELQIYDYTSRSFDTTFFNVTGYPALYEELIQIFYLEFQGYEKSGKAWEDFPRGDFFDGPESENKKALDLKSSFDHLYGFLEKNKDKGISADDPKILD